MGWATSGPPAAGYSRPQRDHTEGRASRAAAGTGSWVSEATRTPHARRTWIRPPTPTRPGRTWAATRPSLGKPPLAPRPASVSARPTFWRDRGRRRGFGAHHPGSPRRLLDRTPQATGDRIVNRLTRIHRVLPAHIRPGRHARAPVRHTVHEHTECSSRVARQSSPTADDGLHAPRNTQVRRHMNLLPGKAVRSTARVVCQPEHCGRM